MFYGRFEDRLESWTELRQELETHPDPLNKVVESWSQAPLSSRTCDPYDPASWPDPWELVSENEYCDFTKILAIYYTLSLTDRFQDKHFEISICMDRTQQQLCYLLFVEDTVIGYYYDRVVDKKNLPSTLNYLANYTMTPGEYH